MFICVCITLQVLINRAIDTSSHFYFVLISYDAFISLLNLSRILNPFDSDMLKYIRLY